MKVTVGCLNYTNSDVGVYLLPGKPLWFWTQNMFLYEPSSTLLCVCRCVFAMKSVPAVLWIPQFSPVLCSTVINDQLQLGSKWAQHARADNETWDGQERCLSPISHCWWTGRSQSDLVEPGLKKTRKNGVRGRSGLHLCAQGKGCTNRRGSVKMTRGGISAPSL